MLTGGVALNAIGNMRLLEHFDEARFAGAQQRNARLHLWVPPVPGDPGVTIGAAWLFAHLAGSPRGAPMTHAFYCGLPPSHDDIASALNADDVASQRIGDISTPQARDAIADLMAFMVARGGVIALFQGCSRNRSAGARPPLDPRQPPRRRGARAPQHERVKYREAIRPLAPMATLEAAQEYFELLPGASDADYNAYNYMVLTAQSKPHARDRIPAVIHADGTGRIQIVRDDDDPLTYAYLKALGRHIGVEVSVNTSFNVAGPIAQTPQQAIDTLHRSKGLDVVLLVAGDGAVYAAWHGGERDSGRFTGWFFGMEIRPDPLGRKKLLMLLPNIQCRKRTRFMEESDAEPQPVTPQNVRSGRARHLARARAFRSRGTSVRVCTKCRTYEASRHFGQYVVSGG